MDIQFYFDFGSPNAYLSHRVIPDIEARTGARFVYVPILLGGLFKLTGNQAPMMAFASIPNKIAYEHREMQRFIERYQLPFKMNPHFPVNTLMLMRGAAAAELSGDLAPYVEAMFHYMWEDPRKMDDPEVLAASLAEAGLPAADLMVAMQEVPAKERLTANTQAAYDAGAFGSPSFLVGEELYFGKDKLDEIERVLMLERK